MQKGTRVTMTRAEKECANAPEWYTLPRGVTWADVVNARAAYGIRPDFFPIAIGPNVYAWGRPMHQTPDGRATSPDTPRYHPWDD